MPQFQVHEDFEPSREMKSLWRYTRKLPATYGGVKVPGLFQTSNPVTDTILFIVVLVLELWGLYNFLQVGRANPVYVVVLFLLDLTLAIFRHLPVGKICEYENRLVFEHDPNVVARMRARLRRAERTSSFISILLLGVAMIKIISFWGLAGEFNGLTAGILVSYLVAAVIHIKVTGHVFFAILSEFKFWMDRRRYINDETRKILSPRLHRFVSFVPLNECQVGRHSLHADEQFSESEADGKKRYAYILETWGVLTDAQLQEFINRQLEVDAKVTMAREGVRHQVLDILQADPQTAAETEMAGTPDGVTV